MSRQTTRREFIGTTAVAAMAGWGGTQFGPAGAQMFGKLGWVAILAAGLGLSGCGPREPVKVPVQGTVLLDGLPLDEGTIYFRSIEEGSVDALEIKNGKLEGMAELGERRVEVCRFRDGEPIDMGPLGKLPNTINTIPSRYNTESALTATVGERDPNAFNFEVTSK
jgi:hypothetical protein